MTQNLAEILLFASVAINAALLLFIAGVLRKVMNDMDLPAFKHFADSLVRHSSRSPFMLIILNIPLVGAIPYWYFYGWGNCWITAGVIFWLVAGLISKALKVPVYKSIKTLQSTDEVPLKKARQKLNNGNILQAILNVAATVIMLLAFIKR